MLQTCPHEFVTTDTALTAYLQSEGFQPDIDDSNPHRCNFRFDQSDKLLELVRSFETGKAEGNISVFFFCYKRLLFRIKPFQDKTG